MDNQLPPQFNSYQSSLSSISVKTEKNKTHKYNTYHIVDVTEPEIWLEAIVNYSTFKYAQNTDRIVFLDLMVYV